MPIQFEPPPDGELIDEPVKFEAPPGGELIDSVNAGDGLWQSLTTKELDDAQKYDILAQAARVGQLANSGNQQIASAVAEKSGQVGESVKNYGLETLGNTIKTGGILASGALGITSEAFLPQNRLGVASLMVSPAMRAYQSLRPQIGPYAKPGIVAQLGQARTKVPAGDIQQAINDPSVFKAPSVDVANKAYGAAVGPLKGAARSLREQTGKVLLGEADWSEAINRPGRILAGTEIAADGTQVKMDPQTALEGIQSINRFTRNKANTAKLDKEQLGELLRQKDELLTFLESNGTTGMRAAASVLRKAHVKENLSMIMPQNKFGGTDALRTMQAGATGAAAASLALAGHPLAAVPLAAEAITASPAFLGGLIRNYHSISNPSVIGAAGVAASAYQNVPRTYTVKPTSLAEHYARQ